MKKRSLVALLALLGAAPLTVADELVDRVDADAPAGVALAQDIWSFAELGYLEERSSARLQTFLEERGFEVDPGVAGIPTAFVASAGRGGPVIGILAEFDALPGLSQAATPSRQALEADAAGHACGHHLFGAASALAGLFSTDHWVTAAPMLSEPLSTEIWTTPPSGNGIASG